jgi:predicted nuclease of predicted toxin-antitoxin system
MRLLLDENLDWRLQRDLPAHQVDSVALIGWAGIENGELLKQAVEAGFEVLITMDSSMVHQQNLGKYPIAVVALRSPSNRLADTRPANAGASRVAPTHQVRSSDFSSFLSASI